MREIAGAIVALWTIETLYLINFAADVTDAQQKIYDAWTGAVMLILPLLLLGKAAQQVADDYMNTPAPTVEEPEGGIPPEGMAG